MKYLFILTILLSNIANASMCSDQSCEFTADLSNTSDVELKSFKISSVKVKYFDYNDLIAHLEYTINGKVETKLVSVTRKFEWDNEYTLVGYIDLGNDVIENGSQCGEYKSVDYKLIVDITKEGFSSNEASVPSLYITANYNHSYDVCHSPYETTKIKYNRL